MYKDIDESPYGRSSSSLGQYNTASRGHSPAEPSNYATPTKVPVINKEYLQSMHTDMTKASNLISKLKKDKKDLQLTLDSTIESYNDMKHKLSENQKIINDLNTYNKILEGKSQRVDFAMSKFEEASKLSKFQDDRFKDLQVKCQYYENLLNKQQNDDTV